MNEGMFEIEQNLDQFSEAGQGLLLAIFTVYQAYFHRLSSMIERVEDVV